MLVLTRRISQEIVISHPDGDVRVMLVGLTTVSAQIGVKAPLSVTITRAELVQE